MVCEATRLQLVEFVANFRWILQFLIKHRHRFQHENYELLFHAAVELENSLGSAMSSCASSPDSVISSTSTASLFRMPLKSQIESEMQRDLHVDEDTQRIASLIRLSCSGYLYLLATEVLLGTSPKTLHSFLSRAVSQNSWVQSKSISAVVEGNCQSFVLLLRWLIHDQILTESDVTQALLITENEGMSTVECCKNAAELLASTGISSPFHLVGHLFLTQQLLLHEFCNLTTPSKIKKHVELLQKCLEDSVGEDARRHCFNLDDEGKEHQTVEELLFEWIRLVVRIELFFQISRNHVSELDVNSKFEGIKTPYIRLLSLWLSDAEKSSDLYEGIKSGLSIAIVLHFYLPDVVPDPYACSLNFSGMWQCIIYFAKTKLNISVPFCASEALEYADSALSLHLFGFLQCVFLSVSDRAESELFKKRSVAKYPTSTFLSRFCFEGLDNTSSAKRNKMKVNNSQPLDNAGQRHDFSSPSASKVTSCQSKVLDVIAQRLLSKDEFKKGDNEFDPHPDAINTTRVSSVSLLENKTSKNVGSSLLSTTPLKPMSSRRTTRRSMGDFSPVSTVSTTPESGRSHILRDIHSKREERVDHTTVPPFGTISFVSSDPCPSTTVVSGRHAKEAPSFCTHPHDHSHSTAESKKAHSLSSFPSPRYLEEGSRQKEVVSELIGEVNEPSRTNGVPLLTTMSFCSVEMPVGVLLAEKPPSPKSKIPREQTSDSSHNGTSVFPSSRWSYISSQPGCERDTKNDQHKSNLPLSYLGVTPEGYSPLPVTEGSYSFGCSDREREDGDGYLALPRSASVNGRTTKQVSSSVEPNNRNNEVGSCPTFTTVGDHVACTTSGASNSTCITRPDTLDTMSRNYRDAYKVYDDTVSSVPQETSGIYEVVKVSIVGPSTQHRDPNAGDAEPYRNSSKNFNNERISSRKRGTPCVITAQLRSNNEQTNVINGSNLPSRAFLEVQKSKQQKAFSRKRRCRTSFMDELVSSTYNGTVVCLSQDSEGPIRLSDPSVFCGNQESQLFSRSDVTMSYPRLERRMSDIEEGDDELAASDISSSNSWSLNKD